MSTLTSFINPPIDSNSSTSTRNLDKSISVIEALILGQELGSQDDMSYKPSDLDLIRQYSESQIEPVKQNYEDLVSCSVCYDVYENKNNSKLPKILPCQHTYCVQCINNLLHCANEPNTINCPQCKFRIKDLKDASDLPTSRIVLTLLEKEALNYQGYASCPSCRQIRNLEVCFHCNLPLCNQCASKHFDEWKGDLNTNCLVCEETLTSYKKRLDAVDPYITKNFENVQSIKNEIDEAFSILIQRLNTEKDFLLRTLNEIKDENTKYVQFKKDVVTLLTSFKAFRESNETYEKKAMNNRMKKIKSNFDDLNKIQQEYTKLSNTPFKIVEGFERKQLPDQDYNYAGSLLLNEFNLEVSSPTRQRLSSTLTRAPSQTRENYPRMMAPLAPTAPAAPVYQSSLRNSVSSVNIQSEIKSKPIEPDPISPNLSTWISTSSIKPQSELTIKNAPTFMASSDSFLFCMDITSNLLIFERNKSELKFQNSYKMTVPNPKGIAINNSYLAVCYSGSLKKDQMKGVWKNTSPNGVMLFSRQEHVVCSVHDKIVELKNSESFKQPSAVALTDQYLFVSDKELRTVFKFNLKGGITLAHKIIINGEPSGISVNKNILVVCDHTSQFYVYDVATCNQIRSKNLSLIDKVNGNFCLALSEDNLIFVRNAINQLCLLDSNLEQKTFFNEIQSTIQNLVLFDQSSQMLVVGGNNGQQFKLLGYNI